MQNEIYFYPLCDEREKCHVFFSRIKPKIDAM